LNFPSEIGWIYLLITNFQFNLTNLNKGSRPYQMTNRAVSAAETTQRILVTTVDEFWVSPTPDLRLEAIARKAKITVQTILRQFGSKENLIIEATKFETARIQALRNPKSVKGVESAVHQLVTHYEVMGDRVLRMLAEEFRLPSISPFVATGRKLHPRVVTYFQ
jgi:AcrR family transcriptional regulator